MPGQQRKTKTAGLPAIHGRAAAIGIGSRFHAAAVGADLCGGPVKTFQAAQCTY